MPLPSNTFDQSDPLNLRRFVQAQEAIYDRVLAELRSGQKRTHWMWYIFPQLDGLGFSSTSKLYGIKSTEEARQYLHHPLLGRRLLECAETVLNIKGRSASEIFGSPDNMKLQSSMMLFAAITDSESVFSRVLDTYFHGKRDGKTLSLLAKSKPDDVPN